MADEGHWRQLLLVDELRQVVDIGSHAVLAVRGPLAVAMAAQVGRNDVPVPMQLRDQRIPVATVIATAVQEYQRWLARIAPNDIMQAQPLRDVEL